VSIRENGCIVPLIVLFGMLAAAGNGWAGPQRGEMLAERWCSQCHAIKPNQISANPDAPRFPDVAAEPSITEYSLRVFLKTPHLKMPNIMMKPDDMDDIVSYILSMKSGR
jgi:mono/diheme cytochrome c family protein